MSIAYVVEQIVDIEALVASGGAVVEALPVEKPYVKDYDAYPANSPLDWDKRFNLSEWTFFGAYDGDRRVAGAALATRDVAVGLLANRDDAAVLFDLRVDQGVRRNGVGSRILREAETWARTQSIRQIIVETQNVNVAACHFYSKHGFRLDAVDRAAYPDMPSEIQLIWHRDLA